MKIIRQTSAFLLAILLIASTPAFAAPFVDDRKIETSAEEMARGVQKQFNLSEEQYQKVIPVFEYHLAERAKLYKRERRGVNKKQLRKDSRAVRTEVNRRLSEIITPEQFKAVQAKLPAKPAPSTSH